MLDHELIFTKRILKIIYTYVYCESGCSQIEIRSKHIQRCCGNKWEGKKISQGLVSKYMFLD